MLKAIAKFLLVSIVLSVFNPVNAYFRSIMFRKKLSAELRVPRASSQINNVFFSTSNSVDVPSGSSGRVNNKIDLSSEKVVHNISLASGEKCVVCRCWKSNKFPLCDGAHVKHNKDTGDNLGPAIIVGK